MGIFQSIADYFFASPLIEFRLQLIGFENAGKTTILQRMKLLEEGVAATQQINTVPTIGMNLEEISVKNVKIKVWDLSGQQKMRNTWRYYYETVNGIIFVVDSSNRQQMADARETLHQVMQETVDLGVPILIFANK